MDIPNKIIKRIFQDHWEEFLRKHKSKIPADMQPSVIEAVNKMLQCGTKESRLYYLTTRISLYRKFIPVLKLPDVPQTVYFLRTGISTAAKPSA